jgi:hypothetical protein
MYISKNLSACLLICLMLFGIAEAKKKNKHSKKQKTEAKSNVIFGMQHDFSIAFPGSLPKPKIDSTGIMTKFEGTQFYSYSANSNQGSAMIGHFDISYDNIRASDIELANNPSAFLDTLQNQLVKNMNGTIQRKIKVLKEGLYHNRTMYFTAKATKDTMIYIRCDHVYNPPRIYQILYTTTSKGKTEFPFVNKFFQSFTILKKQ